MKIALLCSGLGNVYRGHEVFARDLFSLLRESLDITLFKGGGESAPGELVIDNIPRGAPCLNHVHVLSSPKWAESLRVQERSRIEAETFAYAALKPLLEGDFDVIHCLEREVCEIVFNKRHLFKAPPRILFSNGGAIPARDLPPCDFVQEHTESNLSHSAKEKSFMIPHGVDVGLFRPDLVSDFRARHGIPEDAFVVVSVGAVSYGHKRMDYVVREVAAVDNAYLVVAGQETPDTPEIVALGQRLMGRRVVFTKVPHEDLPKVYAAGDVFTLGSVFETFGIVFIEAMATGLPVVCTNHENQRAIVKDGIFIDITRQGELTRILQETDRELFSALGKRGRETVLHNYDLAMLKQQYIEHYERIASYPVMMPEFSLKDKIAANARNAVRSAAGVFVGRSG